MGEQVQLQFELATQLPSIEADPGQPVSSGGQSGDERRRSRRHPHSDQDKQQTLGAEECDRQHTAQPLPGGEYVALIVEDNGKGMAAAMQEKIFDPFFTTKFMGHGL